MKMFQGIGKFLILMGLILVAFGVLLVLFEKIPFLGKLPGDIVIRRKTSFLLSFDDELDHQRGDISHSVPDIPNEVMVWTIR